ncbi:hypothetical protein SDC9_161061 [bioreactor metagenome]|uniref:Uncharacterized protein n=1 Tax=bioreactor metagenome TaxID=1076179 RepID=A0A645FHC2_9ZZZZ
MPDNGIGVIFVLIEEIICRGERNLIDVFIHFVGRHPDPAIGDSQCFGFLIYQYPDG